MVDAIVHYKTDYAHFFGAIALLILAWICFDLARRRDSTLPWSWFSLFPLIFGLREFLLCAVFVIGDSPVFYAIRIAMIQLAMIGVVEFARVAHRRLTGKGPGRWIYIPMILAVGLAGLTGLGELDLAGRFVFGIFGGSWTVSVFWRAGARLKSEGSAATSFCLIGTAGSILAYLLAATVMNAISTEHAITSSSPFHTPLEALADVTLAFIYFVIAAFVWSYARLDSANGDGIPDSIIGYIRFTIPLLISVGIAVLGLLGTATYGRVAEEVSIGQLADRAAAAAAMLDSETLAQLHGNRLDESTSEYYALSKNLERLRIATRGTRFIYLLKQDQGRLVYMATSEPQNSSAFVRPGDSYPNAPPALISAFSIKEPVVFGPHTNEWGTWVSSVAPVIDLPSGEVIAAVVEDSDAIGWSSDIARQRLTILVSMGLLEFIAIISLGSQRRLKNALRRLSSRTRDLSLAVSELQSLHSTTAAIASVQDLASALGQILRAVRQHSGCSEPTIFVLEDEMGSVTARQATIGDDGPSQLKPVLGSICKITQYIFDSRAAIFSERNDGKTSCLPCFTQEVVESFAGIPLINGDQILGVLYVYFSKPHTFAEKERILLNTLATHAAIAIKNARALDEANRLAVVDHLTGLPNRRALSERLEAEVDLSRQKGTPLATIMIDVDDFKRINDAFGHAVGDEGLKLVARILLQHLRGGDFMARYAGDEFLVILPDTSPEEALAVAWRLVIAMQGQGVRARRREDLEMTTDFMPISISAGVAMYPRDAESALELMNQADAAMYRTKYGGGNGVTITGDEHPLPTRARTVR